MAYSDNYILSSDIHVFPCAYRSQNGETTIFDPEARANTERNFTHLATGLGKDSYITNKGDGNNVPFCFFIHGYYFEIKNKTAANFDGKVLCIKLKDTTGAMPTTVLDSFENYQDLYLDKKDNTDNKYYFTGLYISDTIPAGVAYKLDLKTKQPEDYLLPELTKNIDSESVVIGNYASRKTGDIFAVGIGSDASHRANILEVTANKIIDTKALQVDGNIDANNGLDVLGSDLTVGGDKFTIDVANGNTVIAGTATINGDTNITGNTSIIGDTIITGNTSIIGDLTQGDTNKQQVIFNGNINANNGIDILGSDLTVGGSNFTVDTNGKVTSKSFKTSGNPGVSIGSYSISVGTASQTGHGIYLADNTKNDQYKSEIRFYGGVNPNNNPPILLGEKDYTNHSGIIKLWKADKLVVPGADPDISLDSEESIIKVGTADNAIELNGSNGIIKAYGIGGFYDHLHNAYIDFISAGTIRTSDGTCPVVTNTSNTHKTGIVTLTRSDFQQTTPTSYSATINRSTNPDIKAINTILYIQLYSLHNSDISENYETIELLNYKTESGFYTGYAEFNSTNIIVGIESSFLTTSKKIIMVVHGY